MLDRFDILGYANEFGWEAAADLLLLAGPDGYCGSYESYCDLMKFLKGENI